MLRRQAGTIILLVAAFMAAALVRNQVTVVTKQWKQEENRKVDGTFQPTRAASLGMFEFIAAGMKPLVADFYWIKATTLNADKIFEMQKEMAVKRVSTLTMQEEVNRSQQDDRDLYDLLSMACRLDPHFVYAYYYGSQLLSWDAQYTLATSLLERGMRNNPDSAVLASAMSFIQYYFLDDWEKGAEYAQLSYEISGKYAATPKTVANLYAAGRNYDLALTFLADIHETTSDPDTREQIDEQIRYLLVEKHIETLQNGVDSFRSKFGRLPADLDVLVRAGIISKMPEDPFGGKYVLKKNGKVENEPRMRMDHYAKMRKYQNSKPRGGRQRL